MKEEEEAEDKGKDIATGGIELLSRVQKLEDDLKVSEKKRLELIHGNTALQKKLKASREEVEHVHQDLILQAEKHNHDMEIITQVCKWDSSDKHLYYALLCTHSILLTLQP